MILEFFLATAANVSMFFWVMAILSGVSVLVLGLIWFGAASSDHKSEDDKETITILGKVWGRALLLLIVSLPLGSLPSITDLWKVRVGLIKFQLASPENIKAGSETIERIAHKLECQYVGCEEKKEPEKK